MKQEPASGGKRQGTKIATSKGFVAAHISCSFASAIMYTILNTKDSEWKVSVATDIEMQENFPLDRVPAP